MRSLSAVIPVLLIGLLCSCDKPGGTSVTYFDSLILKQTGHLSAVNLSLTKTVTMSGKKDTRNLDGRQINWKDELDIFRQLGLFEKPSYQKSYQVKNDLHDAKSNLLIREYTSRENVPVPEIRFYYFQHFNKLKRIDAVFRHGTAIYSANLRMTLDFEEIDGVPALTSYSVKGSEKIIFSDSIKFSISTKINY